MNINYRNLEPLIEEVLQSYGIDPYKPSRRIPGGTRTMLPQEIAKAVKQFMEGKHD